MDRLGYEVFKVESASAVCPPDICPGARTRRPGVLARLAGGGRPARFHRWVGAIRRPARADLLLPPRADAARAVDLPARPGARAARRATTRSRASTSCPASTTRTCRCTTTCATCSRWATPTTWSASCSPGCGAPGCSRRALIIVTADHGYSFQVGVRQPAPAERGQRRGDRAGAVLREGAGADGGTRGREPRAQHRRGGDDRGPARQLGLLQAGRPLGVLARPRARAGSSRSARATSLRWCASACPRWSAAARSGGGAGRACSARGSRASVLYGDPWAMAYRIGPQPELLGRRVSALRVRSRARSARRSRTRRSVRDVSPARQCFPTRVTGPLRGVPFGEHRDVAVAVNGRIQRRGRQLRPLVEGPRVLLAAGARSRRCAPGATGSRCSRCCRPGAPRAASAPVDRSSARRSGPRRSSGGSLLVVDRSVQK